MLLALAGLALLAACSPSYSPDTYASRAVQQANKVEAGVVVGRRAVMISADGSTGAAAGAAAGGVAGTRVGGGDITSAFAGIGGGLIGGLLGAASEKGVGQTDGYEYVVRKPNGEMISVTQRDETPLAIGQKVLVIAGAQARIVPDYTVPNENPPGPVPPLVPGPTPGSAPVVPQEGGPAAAPTGGTAPLPAAPTQESLPPPAGGEAPSASPAPAATPSTGPSPALPNWPGLQRAI
ncbi:hypothetical protein [Roseomonas sp. USHLN139]|uniref:outer membrane lipoprotein n=1 Tax=Roseomonas sp. USHLN139 TaxID=3081298 RepID=UPI003B024CE6